MDYATDDAMSEAAAARRSAPRMRPEHLTVVKSARKAPADDVKDGVVLSITLDQKTYAALKLICKARQHSIRWVVKQSLKHTIHNFGSLK
jgi:hypothetical protein